MIAINKKAIKSNSKKITGLTKPVIFLDSCSFIEFIYIITPSKDRSINDINNAFKILNSIYNDKVQVISSEICIKEINDNYETAITLLQKDIKDINDKIERVYNTDKKYLGISPASHTNLTLYNLDSSVKTSLKSLIDKTFFIKCTPTIKEKSHLRTLSKNPPSEKKSQYKDCIIWETCLEVKANTNQDLIFATVNKSDFFEGTELKFFLKNEATIANFTSASNLNYVFNFLIDRNLI